MDFKADLRDIKFVAFDMLKIYELAEYERYAEANRETLVVVHVETIEATKNLKETLTVPGIDVIFIGPTDLSSSMGYPGQSNHPEVRKIIDGLVKEIRTAGKVAGTTAFDPDSLRKRREEGFQYITHATGPMLANSVRDYMAAARE